MILQTKREYVTIKLSSVPFRTFYSVLQTIKKQKRLISIIFLYVFILVCISACGFIQTEPSSSLEDYHIIQVEADFSHTMVITEDGQLWGWGWRNPLLLGEEADVHQLSPIHIMNDVMSVSSNTISTMVIRTDNSLWTWGLGIYADGTRIDRLHPVHVMDDVIAVSTSTSHSMIIQSDNSLWSLAIEATWRPTLACDSVKDGIPVHVMDDVMAVSVGGGNNDIFIMVIRTDGSLWAWGSNRAGGLGDGTIQPTDTWLSGDGIIQFYEHPIHIMDDVVAVSTGLSHTMAIRGDGSLWAWGTNSGGWLGDGTNQSRCTPVHIMDDVIAVSVGFSHTMAIRGDGSLWAWGDGMRGQLGTGSFGSSSPVHIMDDVVAVSAGWNHTMAIRTDGSLWGWGEGFLGDGEDRTQFGRRAMTPIKIIGGALYHDN